MGLVGGDVDPGGAGGAAGPYAACGSRGAQPPPAAGVCALSGDGPWRGDPYAVAANRSAVRASWRIRGEPLDDAGHAWFEASRNGDVQDAGPNGPAVLEVVDHSGGHQDEGSAFGMDPVFPDQEAHRAVEHVEEVVFLVRVGSRALRMRLQPPFGDRATILGLRAVGLEGRRDGSHGIDAPLARAKDDGLARRCDRTLVGCVHGTSVRVPLEVAKGERGPLLIPSSAVAPRGASEGVRLTDSKHVIYTELYGSV